LPFSAAFISKPLAKGKPESLVEGEAQQTQGSAKRSQQDSLGRHPLLAGGEPGYRSSRISTPAAIARIPITILRPVKLRLKIAITPETINQILRRIIPSFFVSFSFMGFSLNRPGHGDRLSSLL
jgi:hypothetical protein